MFAPFVETGSCSNLLNARTKHFQQHFPIDPLWVLDVSQPLMNIVKCMFCFFLVFYLLYGEEKDFII